MQTNFFDQAGQADLPPAPTTDRPAPKRVFLYDNQIFEDPGPEYSTQDVLNFLAQTYPELGHATWHNRNLPDGGEEITFVKVTGEKGSQVQVFDLSPTPLLPAPAARRVFVYANQVFADPGPEYTVQDVLNFLAQTYPELGHATWHSRRLPDGSEEITFVKVTGEKGSQAGITPRQLVACLDRLTPAHLPAITLLDRLRALEADPQRPFSAADLLALAPEIEAALNQAEQVAGQSQRMVQQCLKLTPIAQPCIPLGF